MRKAEEKEQSIRYCMYSIIDIKTGLKLIHGFKYKDFSNMQPIRCFRPCPFKRKVYEYARVAKLNGRPCYITYWTGLKPTVRRFSSLTYAGVWFYLDGTTADLSDSGDDKCYDAVIQATGLRELIQRGILT